MGVCIYQKGFFVGASTYTQILFLPTEQTFDAQQKFNVLKFYTFYLTTPLKLLITYRKPN